MQLDGKQIEQAMHHMISGYEGGFAKSLACTWYIGDYDNRRRIESVFQDLINRSYTHSLGVLPMDEDQA